MHNRIEPTRNELLEKERALRAEITREMGLEGLGGMGRTIALDTAKEASPQTSTGEPDAGNISLNPDTAEILFVNFISGRVVTTMGEFDLTDGELAQMAFVALGTVGRNLQDVVNALGLKYGIPQLQKAISEMTNHKPTATAPPPKLDVVDEPITPLVTIDEIDEENDVPPTPTNRPRPRRRV